MKRLRMPLLFLLALFATSLFAKDPRDGFIGDRIAVFYPGNFDASAHMPSYALVKELPKIAPIPEDWSVVPVFSNKEGRNSATILVGKDDYLYGTGEVTGPLVRNNTEITIWNTDNFNYTRDGGRRLYQSHPWVLGVRPDGTSYGVLSDNTWKQELSLKGNITFTSESPAFRVLVIQRDSPQEVLTALAGLIGKMELPPLWSLGYHQCRYSYYPDTRAKQIADEFRNRKLPCDVIWFDIDYMDGFKIFTFDKKYYPDPKEMNRYLHERNFKSIWMIDPGVKVEDGYFVYDSGNKEDVWVKDKDGKDFIGKVWPGDCKFPDFTQAKTRRWWAGLYRDFMANGIDGVWNDMNEPGVFETDDHTMPTDNWHPGDRIQPAGPHLRYHNVYGMQMIQASREGIMKANPDKRPFILSRSGYLGSHRYGATWTGDNKASMEDIRLSIPMSLTLGLSGQVFSGPDIGGFAYDASPELFGQWIAVGAFYPFSRGHAAKDANNKEPWAFGPEIEQVSRVALGRRYRLMPYLYTQFKTASETGVPVMQPLFFTDPKDTSLRCEQQVFLMGPDLMITPKWAVSPAKPRGNWRVISIVGENSKNDKYQPDVAMREGAIVPLCNLIQSTAEYRTDSLTLLVSPDRKGQAAGYLYEDAGDGYGYRSGQYVKYRFTAAVRGEKVSINGSKVQGLSPARDKCIRIVLVTDKGQKEQSWQTLRLK